MDPHLAYMKAYHDLIRTKNVQATVMGYFDGHGITR
jgi:hypothetical protein